ncbi:amidase [Limnohabitans sp.]|uniref:amidase n=1 Tax=Limnohabitans sp. TaxID=1907725 RepID=UPI0035B1A673
MTQPDLHATRQAIVNGSTSSAEQAKRSLSIARSSACEHVFMQLTPDSLTQTASTPGIIGRPLAGLSVSIKDLFDVQGQLTAAGSVVLADAPTAQRDSPAVARLRAAGAGLIGRTNMVEFAFSGVGNNPHHGTPSAWDGRYDRALGQPGGHVPGGSSSGAAVSVATGAAFIGLGSDTGGSIRVPAALNGIVGFKNTARTTPTQGVLPLSPTLDTVCAMTRSARDAILAHEILSATQVPIGNRPLRDYRLGVCKRYFQDGMEAAVARAFERSLQTLSAAGARITEIDLPAMDELAGLNATGGFSPAESYAWHRELIARDGARYDPRVLARIQRGANMKASEYMDLLQGRANWIRRMNQALTGLDAMLSPTVPITAPLRASVAPGAERDEEFFRVNSLLLRNPSAINFLDGCAISLPCHAPDEMPVGLMFWHGAMHDHTLLQLALQAEAALACPTV